MTQKQKENNRIYGRHKIFFVNFIFLIFSEIHGYEIYKGEFQKYYEGFYILNLPYYIDDNVKYIFEEDTPFAIDIIEILVDDAILPTNFRFEFGSLYSRRSFKIQETTEGINKYYISMCWYMVHPLPGEAIFWHDRRGLLKKEIAPGEFIIDLNMYLITQDIKNLEITYRIVLPYPSVTIDNLADLNYNSKLFSNEYKISVDICNFFKVLHNNTSH